MNQVQIDVIKIKKPDDMSVNVIIGQSHFIKTVEDIHEALVTSMPQIKFGIAFCEASGPKLIRYSSTDSEMESLAIQNAKLLKCGHIFIIFLKDAYPINVLQKIKSVHEVCNIFCATANPLEVIVAQTLQGRGIIGVIDGEASSNVENEKDKVERINFLRKIGYKK